MFIKTKTSKMIDVLNVSGELTIYLIDSHAIVAVYNKYGKRLFVK